MTTWREVHTYIYDLSTVPENKASTGSAQPLMYRGHLLSYHMTARRAMKEIPTIARPAIIEELTNLTKKGVLTGQHWVDLTPTQRSKILRSHTNVTHKVIPANDGTGRTTDDGRGQS